MIKSYFVLFSESEIERGNLAILNCLQNLIDLAILSTDLHGRSQIYLIPFIKPSDKDVLNVTGDMSVDYLICYLISKQRQQLFANQESHEILSFKILFEISDFISAELGAFIDIFYFLKNFDSLCRRKLSALKKLQMWNNAAIRLIYPNKATSEDSLVSQLADRNSFYLHNTFYSCIFQRLVWRGIIMSGKNAVFGCHLLEKSAQWSENYEKIKVYNYGGTCADLFGPYSAAFFPEFLVESVELSLQFNPIDSYAKLFSQRIKNNEDVFLLRIYFSRAPVCSAFGAIDHSFSSWLKWTRRRFPTHEANNSFSRHIKREDLQSQISNYETFNFVLKNNPNDSDFAVTAFLLRSLHDSFFLNIFRNHTQRKTRPNLDKPGLEESSFYDKNICTLDDPPSFHSFLSLANLAIAANRDNKNSDDLLKSFEEIISNFPSTSLADIFTLKNMDSDINTDDLRHNSQIELNFLKSMNVNDDVADENVPQVAPTLSEELKEKETENVPVKKILPGSKDSNSFLKAVVIRVLAENKLDSSSAIFSRCAGRLYSVTKSFLKDISDPILLKESIVSITRAQAPLIIQFEKRQDRVQT